MPAYKDKARNTWFCKFTYTDITGQRRQKKKRGFSTKKEALIWERNFLVSSGDICPVTFNELTNAYLSSIEGRCRRTTITTKRYVLDTKVSPFFGSKRVDEITPGDIRKWQTHMINQGFKPTYLRFMQTQLSAVLNYGVNYYGLKDNPCIKAGTMGKSKSKEMEFWTEEEYRTFIEKVDMPKYRMLFELLYWTGIREGEALALTPRDIDFEKRTVHITKTYVRLAGGEELINPPKTEGSNRFVAMPEFLEESLKQYVEEGGFAPGERLFKTTKTSLRNAILRYCKRADVKVIRIHDIRHSHASLLIKLGVSPKIIASRLGHDNVQTTLNIYAHLYPNAQEEVAETLQGIYLEGKIGKADTI